ncbi:glycosyltransferase [Pseudomonas sp. HS6-2]|uniref:glycosyltransferase n=1 Tax=Pseudomonas sp. HS6-2 TaxID=3410986 RepID=UPI003BE0ED02
MSDLMQLSTSCDDSAASRCDSTPLFSVIITTFNRPNLLADALNSLSRQTFADFEALLVNDKGCPVESSLVELPFPIMYIRQAHNRGPAAARNTAHRLAQGQYIVYLDDDDLFLPNHLETLAQAIEQHPDEIIYSDAIFIIEELVDGKRVERHREQRYTHGEYSRDRLLTNNYIPVNTFAFPRRLLALFDGFDENLKGLEDWDFLMHLTRHANFRHIPRETVEVRMRSAKIDATRRSESVKNFYPALYRQLYDRHPVQDNDTVHRGRAAMLRHLDTTFTPGQHLAGWLERRTFTPAQRELASAHLAAHPPAPSFAIAVIDLEGDLIKLAVTLESLQLAKAQYPHVIALVMSTSSAVAERYHDIAVQVTRENWLETLNQSIAEADFDWLGLIHAGDEIIASGLLLSGLELLNAPDCRALYFDLIYRQADGSQGPGLRPDFNLDYLLSLPSVMGRHWLFRRGALIETGGFDSQCSENPEFELVLRLITAAGLQGLGHIPEVLLKTDSPPIRELAGEKHAILQHLSSRGYEHANARFEHNGQYRISYGHTSQPLVSILVLAGDDLGHLQRCIDSVLEKTRYSHFELLLIRDNPEARDISAWLRALEDLAEARLLVINPPSTMTAPAALDYAAGHANGSYLLLLSPETVVIKEDWLDELLNHAQRPEVGAVGPKLVSPEGAVVQAGLILGLNGVAGPAFAGEFMDSPGYLQRLQVDQNYSALSKDCLMIARETLDQINGIDPGQLTRYFDVDLCLRIRDAGYLNVWASNALLLSTANRKAPPDADDDIAMYQKWLPTLARDPAYNPNLSLASAGGFGLADNALSWRPLSSWKPLPTVLAYPLDNTENRHLRVTEPMLAMTSSGLIEGVTSQVFLQPCELERLRPDSIIVQYGPANASLDALQQINHLSYSYKILDLGDHPALGLTHAESDLQTFIRYVHRALPFADRILVATESFADAIGSTDTELIIVPSRLPGDLWGALASTRDAGQRPRIGWAGDARSATDLRIVSDVIKALAQEVEWVIMGACPAELRRYVHEIHDEPNLQQRPQKLAQLNLDLALAPRADNPANLCRSNLQVLEYGACGYPVIRSKLDTLSDNLPTTPAVNNSEAWINAIRMHLNDKVASAQLGQYLQAIVRSEWLLKGHILEAWKKAWLPA